MTEPDNKSTQQNLLHRNIVALHIATSTTGLKKGFPPPICHKLVGYGAVLVSAKTGKAKVQERALSNDEVELLKDVAWVASKRDVINFVPQRFTLPVLQGSSFRTGYIFATENHWFDVAGWFGNGTTSMSDCATAMGLAQRHPLDISLALKEERFQDIGDQLLIDAFLTLCLWMRQGVADGHHDVEVYRKVVQSAREVVRKVVKEKECKQYVSWKGMLDKKLFLLK